MLLVYLNLCIVIACLQEVLEKRIRPELIHENEIGVRLADVGALDEIKESLQELVLQIKCWQRQLQMKLLCKFH